MRPFDLIVYAAMMNFRNLRGVRVEAATAFVGQVFIDQECPVVPGTFPEFIADLEIFFGQVISVTVLSEPCSPIVSMRVL